MSHPNPETVVMACPWCDSPLIEGLSLCPCCTETCGPCVACRALRDSLLQAEASKRALLEERIRSLRIILGRLVMDVKERRSWAGCDFGKTIMGNATLAALQDCGLDPQEELVLALNG